MKRIITLISAAIILSVSALAQGTTHSSRVLEEFDALSVSGIHHVYLTEGDSNLIEVTCPQQYADLLDHKVSDGCLTLSLKPDKKDLFRRNRLEKTSDNEIIVKIQMKGIRYISLTGASELTPKGNFHAANHRGLFSLSLSGASTMNAPLNITGETLRYELSGASNGSVKGRFSEVRGEVSGASELTLDLDTKALGIQASGSSGGKFNGNAETVKVECSGASSVLLKGRTTNIDIQCSGASEVDAEEMIAENASASASGASHIKVYSDDKISMTTSGAGTIKLYGKTKGRSGVFSTSRGR